MTWDKATITKIASVIFNCALLIVGGYLFINHTIPYFFPKTPYGSWPLVDENTGQRVIVDPPQIATGEFSNDGNFLASSKLTVTNNFPFPLGKIIVKAQFLNKDKIPVGEQEQQTGAIKPGGKWELTFFPPSNIAYIQVANVYAYEPLPAQTP